MKITFLALEFAPSIGLRIIHEILKEKGHDSKIIHVPLQRISDKEIKKAAKAVAEFSKKDGLIGISAMANTFIPAKRLIQEIKKYSNIPIIMGGVHPTFKPIECLKYADYICLGNGEDAMLEFVEKLQSGKKVDNIKNIWSKKDGKVIRTPPRTLAEDLDSLPIPTFDFPNLYVWRQEKIWNLEKNKHNKRIVEQFFPHYYVIITSKGCPFKCKYCINDALTNFNLEARKIKRRGKEHIMKELKMAKKYLGSQSINFSDDDFGNRSVEFLKDFFKDYKKEINLPIYCANTPTSLTKERIDTMIDGGLQRLQIGIQSINDKVNKEIYGRPIGKQQIIKMVKLASKYRHKINICYDILLDTPWEKDDTKIETLKFVMIIPNPKEIWLYSMTLYPGTTFYDRAKKEGLIKNEEEEVYNKSFLELKPNAVNTLFLMYCKLGFPPMIINFFIHLIKRDFFKKLFTISSPFWLKLHFYTEGIQNTIIRKDFWLFLDYLSAPARLIVNVIERKKRTKV